VVRRAIYSALQAADIDGGGGNVEAVAAGDGAQDLARRRPSGQQLAEVGDVDCSESTARLGVSSPHTSVTSTSTGTALGAASASRVSTACSRGRVITRVSPPTMTAVVSSTRISMGALITPS
jgi:hypothetical protein